MNRKKKRNNLEEQSHVILPQTFREVLQLTNGDLNTLLRKFDLGTKGKGNHKLTLLAEHLKIPTTGTSGSGDSDPFLQTLNDVRNMKDNWTDDIRKVPEVKLESIIGYLLAAHDISDTSGSGEFEKYTDHSLKTYKALRAYDLWESGHISGITFNPLINIQEYCALKCLANPSGDTSGTQYNVIVILQESGQPIGASCTCVGGLGEACTHIAGLLFGIEDFVSRGYKGLPDGQATTEKLCRWIVPKGPKVSPKQIKKVSVRKNVPGKVKKEKIFRASEYEPLPVERRNVDFESLKELHHNLSLVCPNIPWIKAVAPAIIKKNQPAVTNSQREYPQPCIMLPEVLSPLDPLIAPAHVCDIETDTNPLSVKQKLKSVDLKLDISCIEKQVSYTDEERISIEQLTRDQSNSPEWFKYRQGVITASNFNRVKSHVSKLSKSENGPTNATENLLDTLIHGNKFKGNDATRYGQNNEPKAVIVYKTFMENHHNHVKLTRCGLMLNKANSFIGASPDRIIECSCHGKKLIEVKCPFTIDRETDLKTLSYIDASDNGALQLKKKGVYYAQVQGQMGVWGIFNCDFVIYNGQTVTVVPVSFDRPYWDTMLKALCVFYREHLLPKMVKSVTDESNVSILKERNTVQSEVSRISLNFPCGKCGVILKENITDDADASINCECPCNCDLWFHWKCVNYRPDPDNFNVEPLWYCHHCARNCDIVL